jgi:hypothetical protein
MITVILLEFIITAALLASVYWLRKDKKENLGVIEKLVKVRA